MSINKRTRRYSLCKLLILFVGPSLDGLRRTIHNFNKEKKDKGNAKTKRDQEKKTNVTTRAGADKHRKNTQYNCGEATQLHMILSRLFQGPMFLVEY